MGIRLLEYLVEDTFNWLYSYLVSLSLKLRNQYLPVFTKNMAMWSYMYYTWIASLWACLRQNLLLRFNVIWGSTFLYLLIFPNLTSGFDNDLCDLCNLSLPVFGMIFAVWRYIFCWWTAIFLAFKSWNLYLCFNIFYGSTFLYLLKHWNLIYHVISNECKRLTTRAPNFWPFWLKGSGDFYFIRRCSAYWRLEVKSWSYNMRWWQNLRSQIKVLHGYS